MLCRDYFYLPPPKYDLYQFASTPLSVRQIVGISRHQDGEVVYRVVCDKTRAITSIQESQLKCDTPVCSHRGFFWNLDFHFPNRWNYHIEGLSVDPSLKPLTLKRMDVIAWRDNGQRFVEWLRQPRGKVDATLTLRTNDGWLIDSWHIYDVKPTRAVNSFGKWFVDLDYSRYQKSAIQWEEKVNFELQYHDCSVVATIARSPFGKRVKRFLQSFDHAGQIIAEMQERYSNISAFFLDASIQEEREFLRAERISRNMELLDYNL